MSRDLNELAAVAEGDLLASVDEVPDESFFEAGDRGREVANDMADDNVDESEYQHVAGGDKEEEEEDEDPVEEEPDPDESELGDFDGGKCHTCQRLA